MIRGINSALNERSPGLFGMPLRQTTGFVESLLHLVGLDWAVPDFSTLSRRQKTLAVTIPYRGSQGPLNLLIDNEASTAIGPRTDSDRVSATRASSVSPQSANTTSESSSW